MSDSSDPESDDFEEVPECDYLIARHEHDKKSIQEELEKMEIPVEGIKITIEDGTKKLIAKKKRGFDLEAYRRKLINYKRRLIQEDMHKTHLVCLLAHGLYVNTTILRNEEILALGLSVLSSKNSYPPPHADLTYLEKFISWYKKTFTLADEVGSDQKSPTKPSENTLKNLIISQMNSRKVISVDYLVFIFVIILRALSLKVRLVMSMQPVRLRLPSSQILRDPNKKGNKGRKKKGKDDKQEVVTLSDDDEEENTTKKTKKDSQPGPSSQSSSKQSTKKKIKTDQPKTKKAKVNKVKRSSYSDSEDDEPKSSRRRSSRHQAKGESKAKKAKLEVKLEVDDSSDNCHSDFDPKEDTHSDDSDFDMEKSRSSQSSRKRVLSVIKKEKGSNKSSKKTSNSKEGTSEDKKVVVKKAREYNDIWAEVFLEEEERWVSVNLVTAKIMCDKEFEVKATPPLAYILSFGNESQVKDVTRRYASRWMTATQKLRVDRTWWSATLRPYRGKITSADKEEDELLDQQLLNEAIPTSIQGLKSHPLYVLRRHLLKFEAIYPAEPVPLGFIKDEPIYSRDCVKTLHTRELWMRKAKVVRIGETPYKIAKARPKYDKSTSAIIKDVPPLELFGEWQVEDYIPPPAKDGKVPRNEYGNVELFMDKMLPAGTVHMREPGLNRVAKKLNIDCAPALTGFDFHAGGSHPVFDGFIVCEEHRDILIDACRQDQEESRKRARLKVVKRARDNWRRLIRMVIVERRLRRKYDTFNFERNGKRPSTASASTQKSSKPAKRSRKK